VGEAVSQMDQVTQQNRGWSRKARPRSEPEVAGRTAGAAVAVFRLSQNEATAAPRPPQVCPGVWRRGRHPERRGPTGPRTWPGAVQVGARTHPVPQAAPRLTAKAEPLHTGTDGWQSF